MVGYYVWHRQLIAKRRFEVAEKTIEIAAKTMDAISRIRQINVTRTELDAVVDRSNGAAPDLLPIAKRAAAIGTRIDNEKGVFAELRAAQIVARVHFPKAVPDAIQTLLNARRDIQAHLSAYSFAAQAHKRAVDEATRNEYAIQVKRSQDVLHELRVGIEQAPSEDDKISARLDEAMRTITDHCEPLFRDPTFWEFLFKRQASDRS